MEGCAFLGLVLAVVSFFVVQIKSGIGKWVNIIYFFVQMKLDSPEDLESQDQVALGAAAAAGPGCHALRCGARGSTCILDKIFTKDTKKHLTILKNLGLLMEKDEQ